MSSAFGLVFAWQFPRSGGKLSGDRFCRAYIMLSRGGRPTSAANDAKPFINHSALEADGCLRVCMPPKMAAFRTFLVDRSADSLVSLAFE